MVKPNVQLVRDYFDVLAKGNMEALGRLDWRGGYCVGDGVALLRISLVQAGQA